MVAGVLVCGVKITVSDGRLARRRFVGAERGSRVLQILLNLHCERVRATEHAPRNRFNLFERRHGFAEIIERGVIMWPRRQWSCWQVESQ